MNISSTYLEKFQSIQRIKRANQALVKSLIDRKTISKWFGFQKSRNSKNRRKRSNAEASMTIVLGEKNIASDIILPSQAELRHTNCSKA